MKKIEIGDQTGVYSANQADTEYHLSKDGVISTGTSEGIDATASVSGRSFLIDGHIENSGYGLSIGIVDAPALDTNVVIGETGVIKSSATGVFASSDGIEITNNGSVTVTGGGVEAIRVYGTSNHVVNNGTLSAFNAIVMNGDDASVVNTGKIIASNGVNLATEAGESAVLRNRGEISGTLQYAVSGGGGSDTVINTGVLNGDVELGADDDVLRNRGTISGTIDGGDGFDKIYTSVSFSLSGTRFEEAHLLGTDDVKLIGDSYGTGLYGNAGRNRIIGGEGGDVIDGGRGNDRLTGGVPGGESDGGDTFAFRLHSGHDTVTDFTNDWDVIRLRDYRGIESFDDLSGRIKQSGGDTVISLDDGDRIVLRDVDFHTITKDDFIF